MSTSTPDPIFTLRGIESPVTAIIFGKNVDNKECIISGTEHGVVKIWNLKTRRSETEAKAHEQVSVIWLCQSPPENTILSQGRDGFIHIWKQNEMGQLNCTGSLPSHTYGFCPSIFVMHGDSEYLAVSSEQSSHIDVFDLQRKKKIKTFAPDKNESKYGMCMCLKAHLKYVLIGYENGVLVQWDISTGEQVSVKLHSESMMCLDYHGNLNKGISGSVDETLVCWKVNGDKKLEKVKELKITNPGVSCVLIRPDGKLFATGGWDSKIRLFSLKKLTPLAVLSYHRDSVTCLAFASDNTLAAGSKDRTISVWNVYT